MYIELYVVKWLKPLYKSAHVKKNRRKYYIQLSRHPQRETKALNYTEHLPLAWPGPAQRGLALTQSTCICPDSAVASEALDSHLFSLVPDISFIT